MFWNMQVIRPRRMSRSVLPSRQSATPVAILSVKPVFADGDTSGTIVAYPSSSTSLGWTTSEAPSRPTGRLATAGPKAKITLRQEARIIHKSWEANRLTSAGFGNRVLVGDPLHNSARNGSTIDRFCETAVIVARGSARLPTLQPGATINAGCQLTSVPSAKSAITAKVGSARVDLRGPLSYHTGSFCSSLDADVLRPPNANARQL